MAHRALNISYLALHRKSLPVDDFYEGKLNLPSRPFMGLLNNFVQTVCVAGLVVVVIIYLQLCPSHCEKHFLAI